MANWKWQHKKSDDSADAGEIPDIMDLANLWDWAGVNFLHPS
jgi:hypothetical protein